MLRLWLSDIRGDRSQSVMARIFGISQSYYTMLENGDRSPSIKLAKLMAEKLGAHWTKFFD